MRLWVTLPLLAGCLLAGCGTGTGQSGASPTGVSRTRPTCDVAPTALVNSVLGTKVGDPQPDSQGATVICRYAPTASSNAVVIRIQTDMSPSTFRQARTVSDAAGLPTTDLPGFADIAYTSVLGAGTLATNTVVALAGTVEIGVSSPAGFEQEKALEAQIFAKFGVAVTGAPTPTPSPSASPTATATTTTTVSP
jgi:hypothetical protein